MDPWPWFLNTWYINPLSMHVPLFSKLPYVVQVPLKQDNKHKSYWAKCILIFFENLPRNITPRVMDPWPLFWYTGYIQSLSMLIRAFSFLSFVILRNLLRKFSRMAKFENLWREITKSYGPLAIILPLHLPYLRDQVWYKFHWSRITNISYWKPTKGHYFKSYGPLAPILVYTMHPVIVHVDTSFQLSSFHSSWEICYKNFQEWQNLKAYEGT